MNLDNATVLITGANRGLGLVFAREALARGARKVYAGVRDPAHALAARVSKRSNSTSTGPSRWPPPHSAAPM